VLSLDQAQNLLGPYVDDLFARPVNAAVKSWQGLVEREAELAAALDATARANNIHCWAKREVRKVLVDHPVGRESTGLGFFAVAFGSAALVRLKFISAGSPSNVATDQQKQLAKHQYSDDAMRSLISEGIMQPPTLLTCGYRLSYFSELVGVELRCDYDGLCLWNWPLLGDGGGGGFELQPLPVGPDPQPAVIRSKLKTEGVSEEAE
jgi:hypothetical protein